MAAALIAAHPPFPLVAEQEKELKKRYGASHLSKLRTVGKADWLYEEDIKPHLPGNPSLLYEITQLGREKTLAGIASKTITENLPREKLRTMLGKAPKRAEDTGLPKGFFAAIRKSEQLVGEVASALRKDLGEICRKYAVEVSLAVPDEMRRAEEEWRKRARLIIDKRKRKAGSAWRHSEDDCRITSHTTPERAQAIFDMIGCKAGADDLRRMAFVEEGLDEPGEPASGLKAKPNRRSKEMAAEA